MELADANRLLDPAPMQIETGYERLPSGVLHVACRTDLHGVTGEMFEWWFRFRPDTQKYIWWHPVDHVFSDWIGGEADTHVGSIHVVEEFFTGLPAEKLSIQFRDATEFFSAERYEVARAQGAVTAAVCGRVGFSHSPPRTQDGTVLGGRLLHIGRDADWGLVLRSHFYMGQDLPDIGKSPSEIEETFPTVFGQALLQHCYNEFTFLSRFLPSLYLAENRNKVSIPLPW
jgi:hypothetical protein